MIYDYEGKGRADFRSGRKDEHLYLGGGYHNEEYRRGWHQARRDQEQERDPKPPAKVEVPAARPVHVPAPSPPPRKPKPDQLDLFA